MDIGRDLRQLLVGLMMGMSKADRQILTDTLTQTPEFEQAINTAPKEEQMSFLQGIKNGRLSEQQLKWFYRHLDAMDKFHRNGGAMGTLGLLTEETKIVTDDTEPNYNIEHVFQNKIIDGSVGNKNIPTLVILRNYNNALQLEDYCTEIYIKKPNNFQHDWIAEFYCTNYKQGEGNNLSEKVYERLNNNNLQNFVNFDAFNVTRSTATRNAIDHSYKILSFYKIKELDKGFVVKFYVQELD